MLFKACLKKYDTSLAFHKDCLTTSKEILDPYIEHITCNKCKKTDTEKTIQYLLRELPLLLNTPKILKVPSSLFVYHRKIDFFEVMYNERKNKLLADNQGALTVCI